MVLTCTLYFILVIYSQLEQPGLWRNQNSVLQKETEKEEGMTNKDDIQQELKQIR